MRIGFIGLGNMGGPMAAHLLAAGHSVMVHDLRPELAQRQLQAGARWADSLPALAGQSDLVMTSLPGPREVQAVVSGPDGIAGALAPGAIYVDLSTNSPALVRQLHAQLESRGVAMLDAPVSGGKAGAEAATLAIYVGGQEAVFERVKPILGVLGNKLLYIGAIGAGSVAKLVHNLISVCSIKVFSEALTLGVKAGVPGAALVAAIEAGAYGQGRGMLRMMPDILGERHFSPARFALKLARKDLGLATELARQLEVPMAAAALVEQDLAELMRRGLGDLDFFAQFTLQEERAGVKVEGSNQ